MEGLNINVSTSNNGPVNGDSNDNNSYQPINLEILISTCLKRRYSAANFKSLLFQFDNKYDVSIDDYIAVISSPNLNFDGILFDYSTYIALFDIFDSKFGLTAFWQYLNNAGSDFQVQFLSAITNNSKNLEKIVRQLYSAYSPRSENDSLNLPLQKNTHGRKDFKSNRKYERFFTNLSLFITNINYSEADLTKQIHYFVGSLVDLIVSFNKSSGSQNEDNSNENVVNQSTVEASISSGGSANLHIVIPKEFIEFLFDFNATLLQKDPDVKYLTVHLEKKIKKYFNSLKQMTSLLHSYNSQNSSKVLKLVWLNSLMTDIEANTEFFLTNCEGVLKSQLKILDIRGNGFDFDAIITNLIKSSIECFCISIVNKVAFPVLKKWKLFIEKQIPLLILRLKENKGASFAINETNDQGVNGKNENITRDDESSNTSSNNNNIRINKSNEGNAKINENNTVDDLNVIDTEKVTQYELAELQIAKDLSSSTRKSSFSPSIQKVIVDCISSLDSKTIKILKLYASEDQETRNDSLINPTNRVPPIDYVKYLEQNEEEDMFASFPSTIIDTRHDFLRSCIALNLIKIDDFALCLKDDAKAELRLLPTTDLVKDINTGQTVQNLEKYIDEIFLSKNPEFDAVTSSALTKFLFQAPGFETTIQYQLAIIIQQLFKNLIVARKGIYLRRLSLSLLLNVPALDLIIGYIGAFKFIKPILNYLDSDEENEEADLNFQDTFTDFGCLFTLLIVAVKRYNVSLENLLIAKQFGKSKKPSFCVNVIVNFGNLKEFESPVFGYNADSQNGFSQDLINDWTNELFYSSSGISDELINQSSAEQCFILVSIIFRQAFMAHKEDLIDLDTFKNGVEYFFQPFLLAPLLGIFNWLEDQIWKLVPIRTKQDKKDFELILSVLNYLLVPIVNEEAKVIHGLIVQFVAPSLFTAITETVNTFNSNVSLSTSLGKIVVDPKTIEVLTAIIGKNDYNFNNRLISSSKFFNESYLTLHYAIKLSNGDVDNQGARLRTHEYSKLDLHPPFQLLEDQITSLVLWCYNSGASNTLVVPDYDPYLLMIATKATSGDSVLNFFVNLLLFYKDILTQIYGSNIPPLDGLGPGGASFSLKTVPANTIASSLQQRSNAKVELIKKQFTSKKPGRTALTKEHVQEILQIVQDVISILLVNYSIKNHPDRIDYWLTLLGIKNDEFSINNSTKEVLKNDTGASTNYSFNGNGIQPIDIDPKEPGGSQTRASLSPTAQVIEAKEWSRSSQLNGLSRKALATLDKSQDELFLSVKKRRDQLTDTLRLEIESQGSHDDGQEKYRPRSEFELAYVALLRTIKNQFTKFVYSVTSIENK